MPLTLHVAAPRTPAVTQAVRVLDRTLRERTGSGVAEAAAPAGADLLLEVRPGLGENGFALEPGPGGATRLRGNDGTGLLHGLGHYLRAGRFTPGAFQPGTWRGTAVPQAPVRGMYFAFNFNNWYCTAPAADLARYAEELVLWGLNSVVISARPADPDDRAAFAANKAHYRTLLRSFKAAGLKVGLLYSPNVDFPNPPADALARDVPDTTPARRGQSGTRVCPSHPAGLAYLRRMLTAYVDDYEDIGLDYVCAFPYDAGGCGCPQCWPWGSRGFVSLCREFSAITRQRHPAAAFILCTWCYDVRPESDGEFAGLDRELRRDPGWVQYIMADAHEDFPRWPLDHGAPGGLPLVTFPEISMWGRYPWGGYGANPLPARLERLWHQVRHLAAGGFPYSEGIFEDLNKVLCTRFFWDRNAAAADIVRDYAAWEFGHDDAAAVARAVALMEQSYPRSSWRREDVEETHRLVHEVDRRLPPWARQAWRWRILYLRAVIDYELITHPGQPHSDRCDEAFEELTRIYRADETGGPDAPPSRRCRARLAAAAAAAPPPPGSDEK